MNFDTAKKLYTSYEARIDSHGSYTRKPPFYYDSLRHAFQYYFNTFNTQNRHYESYASRPIDLDNERSPREYLDDENTMLSIVSFQRFFELFLKSLLSRIDSKLTLIIPRRRDLDSIIEYISLKQCDQKSHENFRSIAFSEAISRFYDLIKMQKSGLLEHDLNSKIQNLLEKYSFLNSENVRLSLSILNFYRNRILHNGNKLPSMLLLDYLVTQHYIPLISQIVESEKSELGESTFFLTTSTGINILDKLTEIKFDLNDHNDPGKREDLFISLLHIGHLKEMGRANLNMDLLTRGNNQARYEYNYRDPKGRGMRFAEAEKAHPNFKDIKTCPCCGTHSMVIYKESIENIFRTGSMKVIEWLKCYTCDYHIRYNAGDPSYFNLANELFFTSE